MTREEIYMHQAIELSAKGITLNHGGPFGCVIVKGDEIVGRGNNRVSTSNDPTAHAEVVAIRDACQNLQTFNLSGCEIYTSCEPCPMCLAAIYWARIQKVYYANTRSDAAAIGFDDEILYNEMISNPASRKIPAVSLCRQEALQIFEQWKNKEDKINY